MISNHWPEESWQRRTPYVDVDIDAIKLILSSTIEADDVTSFELLRGGRFNTNLCVELSDGRRVVLRIYEQDHDACRRDQALATTLSSSVPTPKLLGTVEDPGPKTNGHPVAIFEWVDGHHPFEVLNDGDEATAENVGYALGSTLAAIGDSRRFESPGLLDADLGFRRQFDSVHSSFVGFMDWSLTKGGAAHHLDDGLQHKIRSYLKDRAHLLDAVEGDYRLVHGDYKLSNLLLDSDDDHGWKVRAVLDWEFARSSTPLFDVALLMRHADHWAPRYTSGFAAGFVDAGAHLPDEWQKIAALLDLRNLCGFLNASDQRRQTLDAVRKLIERTVR